MIKDAALIEKIKQRVSYNPETGELRWRYDITQNAQWLGRQPGKLVRATTGKKKYCLLYIDGKPLMAHLAIWAMMTGKWPPRQVDHFDLDQANNKWSNLRLATPIQNKANGTKYSTNTSGFKGVSFDPLTGKWRARIRHNYTLHNLGSFDTAEGAARAYASKAIALNGEFARYDL